MTTLDESREAFQEFVPTFPSTITFNGVTKPCVAQAFSLRRAVQLQGYVLDSAQEVTMFVSDFAAFKGITDRQSIVNVDGGPDLVFITKQTHPDSAVVHLILASSN